MSLPVSVEIDYEEKEILQATHITRAKENPNQKKEKRKRVGKYVLNTSRYTGGTV